VLRVRDAADAHDEAVTRRDGLVDVILGGAAGYLMLPELDAGMAFEGHRQRVIVARQIRRAAEGD
jgi:hypothetical protein